MISEWKVERIQLGSRPRYRVWRRSNRGVEFLLDGFSDEQAEFKRRADADECVRQLNSTRAAKEKQ